MQNLVFVSRRAGAFSTPSSFFLVKRTISVFLGLTDRECFLHHSSIIRRAPCILSQRTPSNFPLSIMPNNDLLILENSIGYKAIDSTISHVAMHKFLNHFWNLGPKVVALVFFYPKLSPDIRKKCRKRSTDASIKSIMRAALNSESIGEGLQEKNRDNFITAETSAF